MAKTDWQMDDIVKPDDMNQIGQEINDAQATATDAKNTAEHHANRHAIGGADELTPADIGAETPEGAQAKANVVQTNLNNHIGSGGNAHAAATTSTAGFMSAADKSKLNGIAAGAQPNAVTSVAGKTGAVTLVRGDVGLGNVTNDAQLKIASNLSDLNNVATARSNLGLTGNSNTTHYHDSRYVQTRVSNGRLQFMDGGVWKDVSAPMSMFKGNFVTASDSFVTALDISGGGVLYTVTFSNSRLEIIVDGSTYNAENTTNAIQDRTFAFLLHDTDQNYFESEVQPSEKNTILPIHFKNSLRIRTRRYSSSGGSSRIAWIGARY